MDKLDPKEKRRKLLRNYAKFSGIGFQMITIIVAGVLLGRYLDTKTITETKWFTLSLSLVSVGFAMYYMIKKLL